MRSTRWALRAAVVLGMLMFVPAAAAQITLTVIPDPAAPRGVAPKLTFRLDGVTAGRAYYLGWQLVGTRSGTSCTAIGEVLAATAPGPSVTLGPAPYGDYGDPTFRPFCSGRSYTLTVRTPSRSGPFTTVATLGFRAPAAGGGSISGVVHDDRGAAVPGSYVALCPAGTAPTTECDLQVSDSSAHYDFAGVAAGRYTVQAGPPDGAPNREYIEDPPTPVTLTAGTDLAVDLTLRHPQPLSGGVTLDGPWGPQSSGIGQVEDEPATIEVPVDAGGAGVPNTTRLDGAVLNITTAGGFNVADAAMFEVRYGSDGRPASVSQLIEGPGQVTSGSGTSLTGCPSGGRAFSIDPTDAGGVQFTFDDGTGLPLMLHFNPLAFPAPTDSDSLSLAADGLIAVANSALEIIPGVAEYNSTVAGLNTTANVANGNYAQALSTAAFSFGVPSLGERTGIPDSPIHGPARFSAWEFSAGVAEGSVNQVLPDPSPASGCGSRTFGADFYVDPSGRVITTHGQAVAGAKVTLSRSSSRNGSFGVVTAGSALLSPGNRRNPDHTNVFGSFGWDVLPGFYRVTATHPGCAGSARSRILRVPPPVTGLVLTLRCPHLSLAPTRTALHAARSVVSSSAGSHRVLVLSAAVHPRHGHRRVTGVVTFLAGHRTVGVLPLDRTGRATLTLRRVPAGRLLARYSGSGAFGASAS